MYIINYTKRFKKSLEKLKEWELRQSEINEMYKVVSTLQKGEKLSLKYKDHQLIGEMKDLRECHIKPDLLLIYQKKDKELILILIDLGSHSYLS